MRPDLGDEARSVAKRDRAVTEAPLEDLGQHRLECARDIVRAYQSSHPASESEEPDLTSKVLTMLEELANWTPRS